MIAEKRNIAVSKATAWVRTKLSFCLLRSTHLCIRGSRAKRQFSEMESDTNITKAMDDAKINNKE